MGKKYLVLCNRHNSVYGDNWGLFWGCRNSQGGYSSDLRIAHRFDESEIDYFKDNQDIPIPIDVLGISEECESEETINKNIAVIIEKGTLNKLFNLELRPLFQEDQNINKLDKEIEKLIDEGMSLEEVAEKFSSEDCVVAYGMEIPLSCHGDADCNDCWIKCLEKSLNQ